MDASPIDHPQAPIGLSTLLMGYERLTSRTAECAIWLEDKVLSRETASFPGLAYHCRPVPLNRSLRVSFLSSKRESRSKLGRAHRIGMKLMAQLQTQIPHPLADQLPCLLAPSRMTDPSVWLLFLVFISQRCFKGSTMQIERNDVRGGECEARGKREKKSS